MKAHACIVFLLELDKTCGIIGRLAVLNRKQVGVAQGVPVTVEIRRSDAVIG